MSEFDYNLSIEELEGAIWSEHEYNSHLVKTCHALRKISLRELTVENIRMLIGQKIGLKYIVSIALEYLEENPWCSGNFYDGDLFEVVLNIDIVFWREHSDMLYRLSEVMSRAQSNVNLYNEKISPLWNKISKEFGWTV